jgi:UDP-2,4-diacetamido-2,4,6-trideoxy-beta-L-altropyranose hydrolase
MSTKRVAIRTDANSEIGTGHFMRCLTLAEELKKNGAQVCFVARSLPSYLSQMLQDRNINLYPLQEGRSAEELDDLPHSKWLKMSQHQDAMQTLEVLGSNKFEWLIVDHYAIDCRWESLLKGVANKIMVIDDLADRQHDCDVLLDQNYYHDMDKRYSGKVPGSCNLLLGPKYALLRDEFREIRKFVKTRDGLIKNILIFFGGIDSRNYTTMALEALVELGWSVDVDIVIGQQHPNIKQLEEIAKVNNYKLHIQTSEMAKLMLKADLAIGAAGSASWERCCLGLPCLVVAVADNQIQSAIDLSSVGASIYIGKYSEMSKFKISRALREVVSTGKIINCSIKCRQIVEPNGVCEISKLITGV